MADDETRPTEKENLSRPSTLDKSAMLKVLKQWFRDDGQHSAKWRAEAKKDFDFKAGDQFEPEEKAQLDEQLRPVVVFNRALTLIKAVAGFEINGRHEIQFLPRNTQDTALNEVLTGASKWMADECDAEDEESEAFQDCVTCGMGWCLSDDALVRLPDTHFATTRLYTGSVLEIDLENGKKLTGTPNHPVLTDRGWKRLHALKEGDNLVTSNFLERVERLPVEQFDKVETRLKDKIDSFRAGREALRFPTAPNDFYADGRGSKVHTVYADGLLLRQFREAALRQHRSKSHFSWGERGATLRTIFAAVRQLNSAFRAAVSKAALGLVQLGNRQIDGFALAAHGISSVAQPSAYSLAANDTGPNAVADLLAGKPFLEIHRGNIGNSNLRTLVSTFAAKLIASPEKAHTNGRGRYSDYISNFFDWKPIIEIEVHKLAGRDAALGLYTTRVIACRSRDVADFAVHDVGTSLGFFIAGDIITSNTENRIEYEEDSAGLYEESEISPLEMYWDCRARKRNVVDARRKARLRQMPLSDAMDMFPGHDADELDARWAVGMEPDEQTKTIEEKRIREENADDNGIEKNDVYIVQMQWSERVPYWLVADKATNKKIELPDKQFKVLKERMEALGIPIIAVKIYKRKFYQAFIGGKVLEVGDAPVEGRFSWECITGEQDKNKGTWFGLVRIMRDPAKWSNKFFSQILHIVNSNAKGGIMAEPDTFDDPRQAEETYARPETITWLKKGALSGVNPKWTKKPSLDFPAGLMQLLEFAISSLRDVTGINLELLGQKDIDQPGILEAMRKQAGMTVLATMFDSLRRFRKRVGRIRLYYIQNFLSDGRLVRITGQDGAKVIPLLRDRCMGEYDVVVDDAPTSPNQKQANWALVAPLLPMFKDQLMAKPQLLLAILEYSPMPARLVEALRTVLAQPDPQQGIQQQMQQLGIAKMTAAINKDQSTAEMQNAKAGATQATAMYDLAMARDLLQKNGFDGPAKHLDNLHKAAQIDKEQATADNIRAKTAGENAATTNTHADTANTHADTLHKHIGSIIDALSPIPQPQQQQPQAA